MSSFDSFLCLYQITTIRLMSSLPFMCAFLTGRCRRPWEFTFSYIRINPTKPVDKNAGFHQIEPNLCQCFRIKAHGVDQMQALSSTISIRPSRVHEGAQGDWSH